MSNDSGLIPRGSKVLVYPDPIQERSESGLYLGTSAELDRVKMAQTEGIVIALGNLAYNDQAQNWCKPGERIIFAKYAGIVSKGKDGKEYRFINDLDVVGVKD